MRKFLFTVLLFSLSTSTCANAEPVGKPRFENSYIGAAGGVAFPFNASNVNSSGVVGSLSATINSSDLSVSNSAAWGAKAGTFFSAIPWLGIEASYYERYPNIPQQGANLTFSGSSGGIPFSTAGQAQFAIDINQVRTVGLTAMAKLPTYGRIAPYAGAGIALDFISMGEGRSYDGAGTLTGKLPGETDLSVGPLAIAGVEGRINKNLSAFAEAKYTRANYSLNQISFTYSDLVLLFGLSLGF